MDAISLRKKDHATLRYLLTELAQAPSRSAYAGGELMQRIGRLMGLSAGREEDLASSASRAGEPAQPCGWTMSVQSSLSSSRPEELRARMAELRRELMAVAAGAEPTVQADTDPWPRHAERAQHGCDKLKGDVT